MPTRARPRFRVTRNVAAAFLVAVGLALPYTERASADAVFAGASSSGLGTTRSSITLARPAGVEVGHVMLASLVINDDDPAFRAPDGWTLVRQDTIRNSLRQAIYRRTAGNAEPGAYTWSLTTGRRIAGGITAYAGVDGTNPLDAHGARTTTTASTSVIAPSITTTVPDTLLVHFAAVAAEGSLTAPAGMVERWEADAPRAKSSRDAMASASDGPRPEVGDTGIRVATASPAGRSIGALVALRPSAPSGPDETPPDTAITSGPTGEVADTAATFSFASTEANSTFACRLDDGEPEDCTSPRSHTDLADGEHTFEVAATDAALNTDPTPAERRWTVDSTMPTPTVPLVDPHTPIGNFPYSEVSGVVASRRYPGIVWAHRDSPSEVGTRNVVYAFLVVDGALRRFPSGELFKAFPVPGTTNVDWEDIAIDDGGYLYVGDIGNNARSRTNLRVYQVREPNPYADTSAALVATYPFRYPSGNYDAESLFFFAGSLYLINKEAPPTPHALFRFPALTPGLQATLVRLATVAEPPSPGFIDGEERIQGADVTPDGSRLAIVTGYRVYLYASLAPVEVEDRVAGLVSRAPAWSLTHRRDGIKEQVEAVTFLGDGALVTASEERGQIRYLDRRWYADD